MNFLLGFPRGFVSFRVGTYIIYVYIGQCILCPIISSHSHLHKYSRMRLMDIVLTSGGHSSLAITLSCLHLYSQPIGSMYGIFIIDIYHKKIKQM